MQVDASLPLETDSPGLSLPWIKQYRILLRLQFSDYRDSAPTMMLFSLLMPLGLLWLLSAYDLGTGSDVGWLLAGNAIMAVCFGSTNFIIFRMGSLRLQKQIDYYGTLPIEKSALVAAMFTLSQMSALPGILSSFAVGHWLYDVPLSSVLTAIPLTLLAAGTLTVVGAMVGALCQTMGHIQLAGNLVYFVVMFLSPVFIPHDRLPLLLRITSYLLPTGQAALAISDAMAGDFSMRFWSLAGALGLWLVVAAAVGFRRLDWRSN